MEDCKDPDSIKVVSAIKGITPLEHLQKGKEASASSETESTESDGADEAMKLGAEVYEKSCGICHSGGIAGAPKTGDVEVWSKRLEQGMDTLVAHAINGFTGDGGMMPPRGGNSELTDQEVKAAVEYMVSESR